jgi:putative oxidoreductase
MLAMRPALGLALLRLTLGAVFMAHGYQKFFVYSVAGVTQGFAGMGIPMANLAAPAVATIELVGGLLVVLGFYHRIAAALLVGVMAGAIYFAKMSGGFFAPGGIEFELCLAVMALTIFFAGGGSYTVEEMRKKR